MTINGSVNLCYTHVFFSLLVTLPKNLQIFPVSPSKPSRRSMQPPYRLPNPLPPLPVRKGVRGRRPKSETIALLKAVAEAAQNGSVPGNTQLAPRPHKKRGPKPGSKVRPCQTKPNPETFFFYCHFLCFNGSLLLFRENLRLHNSCPASRFHRKALLASTLWFQQVRIHAACFTIIRRHSVCTSFQLSLVDLTWLFCSSSVCVCE